ncbi:GNAT family N-acetyltransferase [Hornefia porci]|nr:GNAT family protein [Hornefia porci]
MSEVLIMESKNLIVRETAFDDCAVFAEWENSEDVREFFTMEDDRDYQEIVTEFILYGPDPEKKLFTITLKPSGKPIGRIYLSRINRADDSLDLTRIYIADPENRNKGYGEEAIRMILEYAFINLHMERVTIDHFVKNEIARHLYHKIGFQDEGTMRHAGKKNGKYYDLCLMSMLRAEYYDKIHSK